MRELNQGDKITINRWPWSQTCFGCKFGAFINDYDLVGATAYGCSKNINMKDQVQDTCTEREGKGTTMRELEMIKAALIGRIVEWAITRSEDGKVEIRKDGDATTITYWTTGCKNRHEIEVGDDAVYEVVHDVAGDSGQVYRKMEDVYDA